MHISEQLDLRVDGNADAYDTGRMMPRADDCVHCANPKREHVGREAELKCLFDAKAYQPLKLEEYTAKFNTWSYGKRVEDVLAHIAFAATGGTGTTR